MAEYLYAGYPSAIVYERGDSLDGQPPEALSPIKHLLWGDELTVLDTSADGKYHLVKVRKVEGWIRAIDTQAHRLLEIVFVDIGQGDGALVVTPGGERYVVDAGKGDNMYRFLRWRFGFKEETVLDAAVISHSDSDHYGGFEYLFKAPNIRFRTVYTNGLMENVAGRRAGVLGAMNEAGDHKYVTGLVRNKDELHEFLADAATSAGKRYPTMLRNALDAEKFDDFLMLSHSDHYMPGHGEGSDLVIEVLGPYLEDVDGEPGLRWLGDAGRTKNGHSVVLRLKLNNVSVFLGGDLNMESSQLLLEAHTGIKADPSNAGEIALLVEAARPIFQSDVAKACHHGSADTLLSLVRAINPIATVISSGDDEPYGHPRPDALGAIAKNSRGDRPLVFSTELARSTKESIKHPSVLREQLKELAAKISEADTDEKRDRAQIKFEALVDKLDRSIAVYGAINLRTDGERVVLAYKLERSTPAKGWDIYKLEPDPATGRLGYTSKFD
ncbi:MBL fold metallo-hydrolase [Massilia sp. IC2-477]|uniref:ComEC/Rec2 family competence protein n=1 Tax=Massilia sp. IC2-477 TaxID=2887198 RepID=UPI001D119A2E|nr:MBL fold metallo-hydrolase [Massilia sp. IC2-477]MCC2958196.1 MBL fold metallo-hydrolase [Massilia sp. IC2-477]